MNPEPDMTPKRTVEALEQQVLATERLARATELVAERLDRIWEKIPSPTGTNDQWMV